jgi:hypothetical protein
MFSPFSAGAKTSSRPYLIYCLTLKNARILF